MHHQSYFQDLLDTFVKIATIATPIATIWIGRIVSEKINTGQSIYQKREIIYRELYVHIQKCYGAFRECDINGDKTKKANLNDQIRELSNFIITENLYFSKKIKKLANDIKGKYIELVYIEDNFIGLDLALLNKQDEIKQQIQIELEIKE